MHWRVPGNANDKIQRCELMQLALWKELTWQKMRYCTVEDRRLGKTANNLMSETALLPPFQGGNSRLLMSGNAERSSIFWKQAAIKLKLIRSFLISLSPCFHSWCFHVWKLCPVGNALAACIITLFSHVSLAFSPFFISRLLPSRKTQAQPLADTLCLSGNRSIATSVRLLVMRPTKMFTGIYS